MDGMLREMTSSQLTEWQAFFGLEPWGALIEDHRAGTVAAATANPHLARHVRQLTPRDFFPPRDVIPSDEDDLVEKVHAIFGPMAKARG